MKMIFQTRGDDRDRREPFREFARRRAAGAVFVPPGLLPPVERRQHVRHTLREDPRFRINNRPEGAQAKFDKIADSAWSFFRGTALLFYRDIAGVDAHLPTVLANGDVHPENFGVMRNENGAPFYDMFCRDHALGAFAFTAE